MYTHVATLSAFIINEYFKEFYCVFLLGGNGNDFGPLDVPSVAYDCDRWNLKKIDVANSYLDLDASCDGFIISSKHPVAVFEYLEESIRKSNHKFNQRRYLFLPTGDDVYLPEIFKLHVAEHVTDMLVVLPTKNEKQNENTRSGFDRILVYSDTVLGLLTNKFVGMHGYNDYLLLDMWFPNNRSFLYDNDLYPKKISNLEGRTINVSVFSYHPYSIIGDTFKNSQGIEVELLAEYASKINATIAMRVHEEEQWGDIYPNGSSNGVAKDIDEKVSDIGIGGWILVQHNYELFDCSVPTFRSGTACIVPQPKLLVGWLTPIEQFSWRVWLMILLTLMVTTTGFFLAVVFQEHSWSNMITSGNILETVLQHKVLLGKVCMSVYGLFLGQSMPNFLAQARRVFVFSVIFYLIIGTLYSSDLSSKMVTPRYQGQIDTIQELADSDLNWTGTNAESWTLAIQGDITPMYQRMVEKFAVKDDSYLLSHSDTGKFAFPVERLQSGYIAIHEYIAKAALEKLRPMEKDLYWTYSICIIKKGSVFLPSLNKLILLASQAGLFYHWESQATMFNSSLRYQHMLKSSMEKHESLVKLKWHHVQGTFGIWFIGITISILAFVCEVFKEENI